MSQPILTKNKNKTTKCGYMLVALRDILHKFFNQTLNKVFWSLNKKTEEKILLFLNQNVLNIF